MDINQAPPLLIIGIIVLIYYLWYISSVDDSSYKQSSLGHDKKEEPEQSTGTTGTIKRKHNQSSPNAGTNKTRSTRRSKPNLPIIKRDPKKIFGYFSSTCITIEKASKMLSMPYTKEGYTTFFKNYSVFLEPEAPIYETNGIYSTYRPKLTNQELRVVKELTKNCGFSPYCIFVDNYIFSTSLTQIDIIAVWKYGILIIECKDWHGKLYGGQKQDNWKLISANGRKTTCYSPIQQNRKHITALNDYDDYKQFIDSIIVFGDHSDITHLDLGDNQDKRLSNEVVTTEKNLCDAIKNLEKTILTKISGSNIDPYENRVVFTDAEIYRICQNINSMRLKPDSDMRSWHNELVDYAKRRKEYEQYLICPKCGSKLVERKSKNGPFLGCRKYPKCKYTKSI